jgi:peptidyl-prolyl cis-trans isomerase C
VTREGARRPALRSSIGAALRARWLSCVAAVLALGLVACAREDRAVVARVGGDPVLFADFEAYVRTEAGDDWMGLPEEVLRRLFQQFLDEHLLARLARDEGIAAASADRVSALAGLREKLRAEPVGDDEVRLYIEAHPEELRRPERLVLGQLLLPDRKTALEAWGRVRSLGDFDATAREMSDRPGVVYGGYTDDVSRQDLPPEFRDALFALPPGEVSGVIEADYGYHLFHVREHRPEEVLPFEAASRDVAARLERDHADRAIGDMLAKARRRFPVEVLDWNLPFLWDVGEASGAEKAASPS